MVMLLHPHSPHPPHVKESMKLRDNLYQALKHQKDDIYIRQLYREARNETKSQVRQAKSKHYLEQCKLCKGDSASTWKLLKKIIPDLKKSKEQNTSGSSLTAEDFNKYFASVGEETYNTVERMLQEEECRISELDVTATCPNESPHINSVSEKTMFRPSPVDVNTIILIIKQMSNSNSCGVDGISARFIKDSLIIIAYYLTVVINTSIVTGIFPSRWKEAVVVPLFKKGDVDSVSNYRPISLLPAFSKILEKVIANQTAEYLEENNLLSNTQHGFRCRLSTETAMLKVTEQLFKNVDNKQISVLLLTDLSKAFDSVCHHVLLDKMKKLALDDFWYKDYLSDRCQAVKVGRNMSGKRTVSYGVPQGSTLGPLLFNLHVNDMNTVIKEGMLIQFADDSQILIWDSVRNLDVLMNKAAQILRCLRTYYLRNGLLINVNKTQFIFIGSKEMTARVPEATVLHMDDYSIKPSNAVTSLGVCIDQHLSFSKHISLVKGRATGTLLHINKIKHLIDKETRKIMVESLVLSKLFYCLKIWGNTTNNHIMSLQKTQNFAAKVVDGFLRKSDRASNAINHLAWLKINNKYKYDMCIMAYKIMNGILPNWLFPLSTRMETSQMSTRQADQLDTRRTRTTISSRGVDIEIAKYWNKIPIELKDIGSISNFKNKVHQHFLNLQINNVVFA